MKFWPSIRLTGAALAAVLSVAMFATLLLQGVGPSYCPRWLYDLPISPEQLLAAAAAIFLGAMVYVACRPPE